MIGIYQLMLKLESTFPCYEIWLGHRTQDNMESRYGTVERLMYACSEDDDHEQRTRLEARKPSRIPFTISPQSPLSNALLLLPRPYRLQQYQRTRASTVDHRWLLL